MFKKLKFWKLGSKPNEEGEEEDEELDETDVQLKEPALVQVLSPEDQVASLDEDEENFLLKQPELLDQKKKERMPHPITDPSEVKEVMKCNHDLQVDNEGTIWFCPPKGDYDPPRPGCFEDKPAKIPRYQQLAKTSIGQ